MHQNSIRIYTEDVDYLGIVYHANYLLYFERSRTEMLRNMGLFLSDLMKLNCLFVIKKLEIDYISPAKLDDLLTVTTKIKELRGCSFVFEQFIHRQQEVVCEARIQLVCVDNNLKPRPVPQVIKANN